MGVVCSQSLGKIGNSVVPEFDEYPANHAIAHVKASPRDVTDNIRRVKPAPSPQPSAISLQRSQTPISAIATTPPKKPTEKSAESLNRVNSCSGIFTDTFQSPHRTTSTIDTNSILFRGIDNNDSRLLTCRPSIDTSRSADNPVRFKSNQQISVSQFELCKPKDVLADAESPRPSEKPHSNSSNLSKAGRRFGGSFQTLLNSSSSSSSNGGKPSARTLSASENNLSALSVSSKRKALSPKRYSTNSDYCPSVLFNRIANKRNEEKNWSLSKWKNYFMVNVLRKKRDTSARKR